jgi:hypothetical protein
MGTRISPAENGDLPISAFFNNKKIRNLDRVRPQLGAKTQARLALDGRSDDIYLAGHVQQPARYWVAKGSSSIITVRIRIHMRTSLT